jgi:hypothetical protein
MPQTFYRWPWGSRDSFFTRTFRTRNGTASVNIILLRGGGNTAHSILVEKRQSRGYRLPLRSTIPHGSRIWVPHSPDARTRTWDCTSVLRARSTQKKGSHHFSMESVSCSIGVKLFTRSMEEYRSRNALTRIWKMVSCLGIASITESRWSPASVLMFRRLNANGTGEHHRLHRADTTIGQLIIRGLFHYYRICLPKYKDQPLNYCVFLLLCCCRSFC